MPTPRVIPAVLTLAVLAGLSLAVPGSVGAVDAGVRHAPVPTIPRAVPAAYDPAPNYEAQSICSPSPKPGTRALARLIKKTYGQNQYIGTSRACGNGGTSEHKDGRALDWMTSVRSPKGRANADALLSWLIGPDAAGVPAGNATRLGIMYIGWNNRFWAAYSPERGWTKLDGCPKGSDTTCHRNHMHISLTWDGASGRTSMWDGTALAPFCASAHSSAVVTDAGRADAAIPVTPFRALVTRQGLGLAAGSGGGFGWGDHGGWPGFDDGTTNQPGVPVPTAPCRLHASGWRGDSGGVLTKVTGQGGVPELGVAAVVVKVIAQGSTAPAEISVSAPGQEVSEVVVRVRMNHSARGMAIVPVASDGTIALATSAGGTDLTVVVTGYFTAGERHNRPATVRQHN